MNDRLDGVRCLNCGSLHGLEVIGLYRTECRKCDSPIVIVRAGTAIVEMKDARMIINVRIEDKQPA